MSDAAREAPPGATRGGDPGTGSRASRPVRLPLPPPVEVGAVRIILVGSVVWFLIFLGMLPFVGDLYDAGRAVWLWTALAGWVLGLVGIGILLLQRRARRTHDPRYPRDPHNPTGR